MIGLAPPTGPHSPKWDLCACHPVQFLESCAVSERKANVRYLLSQSRALAPLADRRQKRQSEARQKRHSPDIAAANTYQTLMSENRRFRPVLEL